MGREVRTVAKAWLHLQITDLKHIPGPGPLDINRPGHHMYAGVAVILRDLVENRPDGVIHHQFGRVTRMMCNRLGTNDVTARDFKGRGQTRIEIPPMDSLSASP